MKPAMASVRYFDDVRVGDELPPLAKGPMTSMHLMRWSAAIENWHRIHYDFNFAVQHDGLPDVIVSGSWKQHVLAQLLKDWAGPSGFVVGLRCQYRGLDACGATIAAHARVQALERHDGFGLAACAVELRGSAGAVTTQGEGIVMLPLNNGPGLPYPALLAPAAAALAPEQGAPKILAPQHLALLGQWGARQYAPEPVEAGSVRRFTQAIMDPDPLYWDAGYAKSTRFGGIVAPPLYPLHAIRCPHAAPDPLEAAWRDPDFDGFGQLTTTFGLAPIDIPLKRFLNGGFDQRIMSLARVGETISAVSCYEQLYEKAGKNGPLVVAVILSRYEAESPGPGARRELLTNRQTYIWR